MPTDSSTPEPPDDYNPYFYVSYAHSPDAPESQSSDRWVSTFFGDLEGEVKRSASSRSSAISGFFDQRIPPDSDWKELLGLALGRAQVFVPLYSAGYFHRSWPGREWACYRRRLELGGQRNPESRFIPVLWAPLLAAQDPPDLGKALALGGNMPEYAENGLLAMMKIRSYHDSYRKVVSLLARQIVTIAEGSPILPSEAPDIDELASAFALEAPLATFTVQIAKSARRPVNAERDLSRHSDNEWRPFPDQELSLTHSAMQVVERFDFHAEVGELRAATGQDNRRPGIILIDPWFIADEAGRSVLESAARDLPEWVFPLTVLDQPGDPRSWELASQVRDILSQGGALRTHSSRLAAAGVSSLEDFLAIVPRLVTEAERQYLKHRGGRVRSGPPRDRPSLRRPPA